MTYRFQLEDSVEEAECKTDEERLAVQFFHLIRDIYKLGEHKSMFYEFAKAQRKLKKLCRDNDCWFMLGFKPCIWSRKTGEYLVRVVVPIDLGDDLMKHITAWKHS